MTRPKRLSGKISLTWQRLMAKGRWLMGEKSRTISPEPALHVAPLIDHHSLAIKHFRSRIASKTSGKLPAMAGAVALVIAGSCLMAARGLGQAPAPARANGGDLLKSAPFDRITLVDGSDFDVEPLNPRPLPPVDPKKGRSLVEQDEAARKADEKRRRKNDPFTKRDGDDEEPPIIVHVLQGEPRDFQVKRASIKAVEYFEDMLLAEGDRLVKEGDYARAFERFLLVRTRDPAWRGLDDRVNRLLFEEGSAALVADNARGLQLLNDLHARKPDYPGLSDRLAASHARRIARSIDLGDFLAGRRLLRDLEQVAPGHAEARSIRGRFAALAKEQAEAAARSPAADRVDRLAEAARIWPGLDGLEAAYREAFRAEPTLTVAVADLARPVGPFPRSPAADRVARLLYLPALAADTDAAIRGEAPGQLLASLEITDLGKGLKIRLKPGPTWSDGSRPASAIDLARSLADRALPESPGYDARWAELLDRVEATGEDRVEVRLTRSGTNPEAWLLDPIGPAHAAADGWVSVDGRGRLPVGDGPYRWEPDGRGTLLRASGPAGTAGTPKVRRIREVRFAEPWAALEALARGEVALLEHLPPDRLAEIAKDSTYKVGRYATPSVHRIAIDARTPALRSRKLRRALSLAIDRRVLLEEVVLRRPPDEANRVADGPFVHGSFVDAPGVAAFEYDPLLAKGLASAARKELGGNPIRLTLEYPSIAEARAVCPKIAEAFGLIGVAVQLVERPESELESGLRSGRRFDLAYRASRPGRPLLDAGPLLVPGYDAPGSADALASAASARILQLLIQLDRAPETTSARTLALQIDREARDELPVLPLWELQDHYAWRVNLRGPSSAADRLYQGIAEWEVQPWFAREP